ncbi:GNAT family N-acetyltransferase [Rhizobium sp. CSW-27]|uniref:GNAT family N-acetyltransferase n=1 Tax=Rhizobium sp. CSW-27 TaxID=2839985 RepID=UPI001C0227A9|nr:GNAT family N-acetyltransferase [Rhizobium sp. CSW-27]MBT9371014.1 GNAT family N-acetyltransferase [Rhizobium sp. CSW-27]
MTQACFPIATNARWPDGLTIRARLAADAAGIASLHNLPGYRHGTLRTPYHSAEEIRKGIENQPATVTALVAVLEDQIVGDIGLTRHAGRRAHSGSFGMGVHDAYRGRGIGSALLGEVVAMADNWYNLRRLEMTVYADNGAAIALYRKFGFEVEGTLRTFAFRDGAYVDALTMARLRA